MHSENLCRIHIWTYAHFTEQTFVPVVWTYGSAGAKATLITDNLQHSRHGFFKFKINLPYIP